MDNAAARGCSGCVPSKNWCVIEWEEPRGALGSVQGEGCGQDIDR